MKSCLCVTGLKLGTKLPCGKFAGCGKTYGYWFNCECKTTRFIKPHMVADDATLKVDLPAIIEQAPIWS